MIYLYAGIGVLVLYLLYCFLGRGPRVYRDVGLDRLVEYIDGLRRSGYDGTALYMEHNKSDKFTKLVKWVPVGEKAYTIFEFPVVDWSLKHVEDFKALLEKEGFSYEVKPAVGRDSKRGVKRFIQVPCGLGWKKAEMLAKSAFAIMNLGPEEKYNVHFRGRLSFFRKAIGFDVR